MSRTYTYARTLCECGCGVPAPVAKFTRASKGHVRGQPVRFLPGHNRRGHDPRPDLLSLGDKSEPDTNGGCLLWWGATQKGGYGVIVVRGKTLSTHRYAWELANGRPPPADLLVRHSCDVRVCVNPAHLSLGTHLDNVADMVVRRRASGNPKGRLEKLSPQQVQMIRDRWIPGDKVNGTTALAKELGLTRSAVRYHAYGQQRRRP